MKRNTKLILIFGTIIAGAIIALTVLTGPGAGTFLVGGSDNLQVDFYNMSPPEGSLVNPKQVVFFSFTSNQTVYPEDLKLAINQGGIDHFIPQSMLSTTCPQSGCNAGDVYYDFSDSNPDPHFVLPGDTGIRPRAFVKDAVYEWSFSPDSYYPQTGVYAPEIVFIQPTATNNVSPLEKISFQVAAKNFSGYLDTVFEENGTPIEPTLISHGLTNDQYSYTVDYDLKPDTEYIFRVKAKASLITSGNVSEKEVFFRTASLTPGSGTVVFEGGEDSTQDYFDIPVYIKATSDAPLTEPMSLEICPQVVNASCLTLDPNRFQKTSPNPYTVEMNYQLNETETGPLYGKTLLIRARVQDATKEWRLTLGSTQTAGTVTFLTNPQNMAVDYWVIPIYFKAESTADIDLAQVDLKICPINSYDPCLDLNKNKLRINLTNPRTVEIAYELSDDETQPRLGETLRIKATVEGTSQVWDLTLLSSNGGNVEAPMLFPTVVTTTNTPFLVGIITTDEPDYIPTVDAFRLQYFLDSDPDNKILIPEKDYSLSTNCQYKGTTYNYCVEGVLPNSELGLGTLRVLAPDSDQILTEYKINTNFLRADLNRDGTVDLNDILMLTAVYGYPVTTVEFADDSQVVVVDGLRPVINLYKVAWKSGYSLVNQTPNVTVDFNDILSVVKDFGESYTTPKVAPADKGPK